MVKEYPKNPIPPNTPAPQKITPPTIGRVVYYYHPSYGDQPLPAIIANVTVHGLMVNLGWLSPDGVGSAAKYVPHMSEAPPGAPCWDWPSAAQPLGEDGMPSSLDGPEARTQKGQQAKTEQLEEEISKMVQSSVAPPPQTK